MTRDLRQRLEAALHRDGPPSSDYDLNPDVRLPADRKLRDASVLVPIICRDDEANVILTKRTSTLKHHPGQIAFPGGKVEDDDRDVTAAALREAQEEIGLPPAKVDAIGVLPFHETVTNFTVTPVLSLVEPFEPVPQQGEVAEVFEVPLAHLMNAQLYSVQSRRWRGVQRSYYTVPYGPYYIWGATARMLRALSDRMNDAD